MNHFRIGDRVSTTDGRIACVKNITILYTLDDGSLWNERLLSMVERTYTDGAIIDELCKTLGTTRAQLRTKSRRSENADKRQVIMYVLRRRFHWTLQHIAEAFNRNHSTVSYAVNAISDLLDVNDKLFTEMVHKLEDTAYHITPF